MIGIDLLWYVASGLLTDKLFAVAMLLTIGIAGAGWAGLKVYRRPRIGTGLRLPTTAPRP